MHVDAQSESSGKQCKPRLHAACRQACSRGADKKCPFIHLRYLGAGIEPICERGASWCTDWHTSGFTTLADDGGFGTRQVNPARRCRHRPGGVKVAEVERHEFAQSQPARIQELDDGVITAREYGRIRLCPRERNGLIGRQCLGQPLDALGPADAYYRVDLRISAFAQPIQM